VVVHCKWWDINVASNNSATAAPTATATAIV
jgi:hypothetical protein